MEIESTSSTLLRFTQSLPKVELHAHLHGCIRAETLRDLAKARGISISDEQQQVLAPGGDRSLSDCFEIFHAIHIVVADLPAVRRIALEALLDMRKHNVRYAELRTTPRILPDGTSPRAYIEAVLGVFRDFEYGQSTLSGDITSQSFGQKECTGTSRLIPRLLLSVDRGRTVEEAMYAVKLAIGLRDVVEWTPYVVGIDFSGNPTKGAFRDFRPAFEAARRAGLKITVHCGEVSNDAEFREVIAFRPERLGHAAVLGNGVREALLSLQPRIPIEVCPTSNLLTLALSHHREHPTVQGWIEEGYPFSINTDDSGVFDTDLSMEYTHLAASNGLDKEALGRLACRAVQDIFDAEVLPSLAESFRKECDVLMSRS